MISEKSLFSLNIDMNELFFSKAGAYAGEKLNHILDEKSECIKNNRFCLWAFANNAVTAETVRKLCRKRKENNIDTYVLFSFTESPNCEKKKEKKYNWLDKDDEKELTPDEKKFLGFTKTDGKYEINLKCTGLSNNTLTFVITDLFFISEYISEVDLSKQYKALGSNGKTYECFDEEGKFKSQRSTYYLSYQNNGNNKVNIENLCLGSHGKNFCFMAKLAAPYVIRLNAE